MHARAYLRGGGSNPPPKFSDFFLKSEGKEIERKKNEKGWGGGGRLIVNIFLGSEILELGSDIFREGGWEIFGGGG